MGQAYRMLMIGVDHPVLEAAAADMRFTVVMGASAKDGSHPVPPGVQTVFVDDHKNIDAVLNALYRAGHGEGSFDAVYAGDDPVLMTAAAVASVLGASAVPAETVARFRDKFLQKRLLRAAGVPVADHDLIDDIRDLPTGYRLPFPKAVVKPVAGMATQSTFVVTSDADLTRISAQCRANAVPARTFVVEEFISGDEWFVDGIMSQGRLRFMSIGRYAQSCLTAVREHAPVQTFSLDPADDGWAYELATPLVTTALSVLGLTDGVFHMELFHDTASGRLVFSECAARRGGGPIRDQIRYKYGVDLAVDGVRALVEPVDKVATSIREGVVASTFLQMKPGIVIAAPTAQDLLALDQVAHVRMFVPLGVRMQGGAANTFYRMGEVTVHTADVAGAERRLAEVIDWFAERIDTLPLNPTLRELYADPRNAGFQHEAG